jgi:cobyrinic acid a,c-diamide synthase
VLVVDVSAQARSAAAVVLGFERFDPAVDLAGVILNRVGGARHARDLRDAIEASSGAIVLGAIEWDRSVALPERHLGLVTAAESLTLETVARLGDVVERAVDVDRLLTLARPALAPAEAVGPPVPRDGTRAVIGIARDLAFQFYYQENLERLRAAGAALVFWSPLDDAELPDVDGLYLGGGYPELHAAALAANTSIHKAIRRFVEAGKPLYAECGGLMYLAECLEDDQGVSHPMVGLLPSTVRMRPRRLTLGYTEATFVRETLLGRCGTVARGHVFHVSALDPVSPTLPRAYRLTGTGEEPSMEGYVIGSGLVSYVHLHFASNPGLASAFVEACARP